MHAPGGPSIDPPGLCHWLRHHNEKEYIWFRGEDLNDAWDVWPFMKWGWGRGDVPQVPLGNRLKLSCKTSYPYLSYPQISEQSIQLS